MSKVGIDEFTRYRCGEEFAPVGGWAGCEIKGPG